MKKQQLLSIPLCLLAFTACRQPAKPAGTPSQPALLTTAAQTDLSPVVVPDPSDITPGELDAGYQTFTRLIQGLKAEECDGVMLSVTDPSGVQEFSSSNGQLAAAWIALLKKMQFVSNPFVPVGGSGFSLEFTGRGHTQRVAGFVGKYVYTTSGRTMLIINNYEALAEEISALEARTKKEGERTFTPFSPHPTA